MEHKTGLALAGAVVAVGGSGGIAVGTFTGVLAPPVDDVPTIAQPVARPQPVAESSRAEGRRQRVERVTRYVDVPMPAPPAGATPVAPSAPGVAPPAGAVAPAPALPPSAAPGDETPQTHSGASPVAGRDDDAADDDRADEWADAREDRGDDAADRREERADDAADRREDRDDEAAARREEAREDRRDDHRDAVENRLKDSEDADD